MLVLCALSDLLLCPGAGIMTGEALVFRVTRMTAKHAGEHRGSVGKGRGGRGRTGLVFWRNECILQLLEHQGVIQQQCLMQHIIFGQEGLNQHHEDQLMTSSSFKISKLVGQRAFMSLSCKAQSLFFHCFHVMLQFSPEGHLDMADSGVYAMSQQ